MQKYFQRSFVPGIVIRLRVVFATIAIVFAMITFFGIREMRGIDRAVEDLSGIALLVFVEAEEAERSLNSFIRVLQGVEQVDRLADLEESRVQLLASLAGLRSETADMLVFNTASALIAGQSSALHDIDVRAADILTAKENMLQHQQNIAEREAGIYKSHEIVRKILEELSYGGAAFPDFDVASGNDLQSMTAIEEFYTQSLFRANIITALTLQIETVIDGSTGAQNVSDAADIVMDADNLGFKMRSIALMLRQLEENEVREQLANEIILIRSLIFAESGTLAEMKIWVALSDEIGAQLDAQLEPITQMSALFSDMTIEARQQVEGARVYLTATTDRVSIVLTFSALSALLAIVGAVTFLVERQINRRMAKLTAAVLAIADGQTNYEVDVSGTDEIGKMAVALDVFKENAEELNRSNAELEKFAYVAAHDLRSPLRAIQDLLDWTLDDEDNVFSTDSRRNMDLLRRRASRLNRLLSDLLAYARAGHEEDSLTQLTPRTIVAEIADLLDPEKCFDICFSGVSGDSIVTYATPLRQILLNLINNAIKHHDRSSGHITVTAHLVAQRVIFSITDDGVGIDPKYHDKIFGLFQTLRPRDDVEGSGLGLAIIRKLVEHYGGTVLIHSDPALGRGAEFTFDLPFQSALTTPIKQAA